MQLGYLKENGQSVVWGEATLEVEIEILFLSFSVSVSCRREFGGSAGDPKFIELIPDQTTWNEYCEAFAAETVVMAQQTTLWTAMPNGYRDDGQITADIAAGVAAARARHQNRI